MMHKIEFATAVAIGDKYITGIEVKPLTFVQLVTVWDRANAAAHLKPEVALQRERLKFQTHFTDGKDRVPLTDEALMKLPRTVAKDIIAALDLNQGEVGKVLSGDDADGATKPILYQLGTPFSAKDGSGKDSSISELEFQAETYGQMEDILAADSEMHRALELVKRLGLPVGSTLMALPGFMLDQLTVADGVTIMRKVLPRF